MTMASHPNILILIVDCLRADACYNEKTRLPLPNIERLREIGCSFENNIAVASSTSPCVSSLLTGTYPAIHGVRGLRHWRLRADVATIAEVFGGAGYRSSAHVTGPLLPALGLDRGFDCYEHRDRAQTIYGAWGKRLLELLAEPQFPSPWLTVVHTFVLHNPARRGLRYARGRYGSATYQQALCNLDEYLGLMLERVSLDDTIVVLTADHGEIMSPRPWWVDGLARNTGLLRLLRALRLTTRDQWGSGRHGNDLVDGLVRAPLVLAGGQIAAQGRSLAHQVSQVDLVPTLAELAGLDSQLEGPLRGKSQAKALTGEEAGRAGPAFCESRSSEIQPEKERLLGVRTDGWKYIFRPGYPEDEGRLYDLSDDPDELRNLAAEQPDKAARLRRLISEQYLAHLPGEQSLLSDEDVRIVERRLRDLGYL